MKTKLFLTKILPTKKEKKYSSKLTYYHILYKKKKTYNHKKIKLLLSSNILFS